MSTTAAPEIRLLQADGQPDSSAQMFQPSTSRLTVLVDYSFRTGNYPTALSTVLLDMRAQNWHIWRGRPFSVGAIPLPSPLVSYRSLFGAGLTSGEIGTAVPMIVRRIDGRIVPGAKGIWHVDIELGLVGYHNALDDIHATVTSSSSSRTASAYRLQPGMKLLTGASQPNLGAPTQNNVFTTCTATSGSNARTGQYDKTNWLTYVKSTMDIGGVSVDINGQPVSIPVEQLNYTLQFVIRRPYHDFVAGSPSTPTGYGVRFVDCMWSLWGQYPHWCLNKRNAETMFGYGPGELVCTNVTNTPIDDDSMMCNVTLTWDEWGHGEQAPWGFEGNVPPKIESTIGGADRPILNADTVYWINPYPESFNWAAADFPYGAHAVFSQMILPV